MVKKIIFFVESPFSNRDYDRFGIDLLLNNGFEVEVWDFTSILHAKIYRQFNELSPARYDKIISFKTKKDAISAIQRLSRQDLIVCLVAYCIYSLPIYRAISAARLRYCVLIANSLPVGLKCKKLKLKELPGKILRSIKTLAIVNLVLRKIPYKYVDVNVADIALSAGDKAVSRIFPIGSETIIISAHALDYDIYLKEQKRVSHNNKGVCVFLDECVPFHPDYLRMRQKPFSKSEDYYPSLCRFFKHLEDVYESKIVIAAHPRSHYEDHPDYFEGRKVVAGKTAELVRDAEFVVAHSSTSINFAVLYKKPLLFITTDSLQKSMQGGWIRSMASSLGKDVINISMTNNGALNNELVVDEKAYQAYKNDHIKKNGSEEALFWQILTNYIKNSKF